MANPHRLLIAALASALAALALPAQAQWNNQPYQLPSRGNGIGLSPAHKQIMLENKLGIRRSNPVVRDSSGHLLEVERRGNLALLRGQASPFLVAETRSGLSLGFGSVHFAYGGGYPAGVPLAGSYSGVTAGMPAWIGLIDSAAPAAGGYAGYPVIDSWIAQLDGMAGH